MCTNKTTKTNPHN